MNAAASMRAAVALTPGGQAGRRLARAARRGGTASLLDRSGWGKRAACVAISVRQKYQLRGIRQEISASLAAFKRRPDREVPGGVACRHDQSRDSIASAVEQKSNVVLGFDMSMYK